MKKHIFVLSILTIIFSLSAYAQVNLQVVIKNINESKGTMRVGLFNDKAQFPKGTPVYGKVVKAEGKEVIVEFEKLTHGEYAISVMHDENENGEMDSNFMGIPKEGFGFGNNAMGTFGPPDYNDAKITIGNKIIKHEITLKYY